jgi:hypothetical protein
MDVTVTGVAPDASSTSLTTTFGRPYGSRGALVYTKHAILHPSHLLVPFVAAMVGVIQLSVIFPAFVLLVAEAFLLAVLPHLRSFRQHVDLKLERCERAAAAEQRAALLLQMGGEHRKELENLERLVDRIKDTAERHCTATAQLAVDDCLGLAATYVRLAIAHSTTRDCLATTDRVALDHEIRALEAAQPQLSDRVKSLAQRRLEVARRRAERWDKSRDDLEVMSQQLAIISALIRLRHEQCTVPMKLRETTREIDRLMREMEDNEKQIRELAELFGGRERIVEPRVLDMGRNVSQSLRP